VQGTLEKTLADIMATPDMTQKLLAVGLTPAYGPGAAVTRLIEKDLPHMRAVAARAGIKAD
jgi:tripartite-type tricarboxylate transporter receptor subunit TctC